jgi:hypothetical protein
MILLILFGCAQQCRKPLAAPTLLPGTDRSMLTAGYWISRHPSPDALVLTAEQIAGLNHHIENDLKTVADIRSIGIRQQSSWPLQYSGSDLAAVLQKDLDRLRAKPRYLSSGRPATGAFYERLAEDMDLAAMNPAPNSDHGPGHGPDYGVVVRFVDQRILPTLEPLYGDPSEVDFDALQNNTLELGTPLLLLHRTRDLKWTYVRPAPVGWNPCISPDVRRKSWRSLCIRTASW